MGKGGNQGEKLGRGGKAQQLYEHNEESTDTGMDIEKSRPIGMILPPLAGSAPTEVIPETQLIQLNGNGKVYKEILASIGLDSPTSSHETRGNIQRKNLDMQQVSTPIRNSAASLMALGKHVFTSRQGRNWECRSKSPLGN